MCLLNNINLPITSNKEIFYLKMSELFQFILLFAHVVPREFSILNSNFLFTNEFDDYNVIN